MTTISVRLIADPQTVRRAIIVAARPRGWGGAPRAWGTWPRSHVGRYPSGGSMPGAEVWHARAAAFWNPASAGPARRAAGGAWRRASTAPGRRGSPRHADRPAGRGQNESG